jgi:hypothetical protein
MPGLAFRVPQEAALELEPYVNEQLGITGVAPSGWTAASPNVLVRGNSAVDQTMLIYDAGPVTADVLLGLIVQQFGLPEAPESSAQIEANGFSWALYEAEAQGYGVDFALAETEDLAIVILLVTEAADRDMLYEALFLPAVEALTILE